MPDGVFLSHSSADREFVTILADTLIHHGVPVWYSDTNILGSQQWHDEIGAALNRCDWMVLVLSPAAVESIWVKREVMFALMQSRYAAKIVPIIRKDCDFDKLSWVLSQHQMVDFQDNFENGCKELLRIWGIGYLSNEK